MKKIITSVVAAFALLLCGCGDNVNVNKTPEQVKAEAASMDVASIQKKIDELKAYADKKGAEAKAVAEKISKIPLTEQMGKDAQALREEASKIGKDVDKVKAQIAAWTSEMKAKLEKSAK